jgi:hypothetical protein
MRIRADDTSLAAHDDALGREGPLEQRELPRSATEPAVLPGSARAHHLLRADPARGHAMTFLFLSRPGMPEGTITAGTD